ncbi:hypothetical protein AMJ80_10200 [bacterium SM23_31]|nr:MAG: hypothetical protein AMJ80_10200 [bacterium SM23_31]
MNNEINKRIESISQQLQNNLVGLLREIIAIPSMNGQEGAVIERLKEEMENIGYEEVWVDPMGNLFGRMGSGEKVLAIDGHADTVDIGNPDLWEVDPFGGEIRDGCIYGRGACDQKGGLAAAVYAGKMMQEVGMPDNTSFLVVASVFEENFEGLSWQYIVNEDKIIPDAVLLTEPTNLGIRIGQRGRLELKVQTEGVSCHGSAPERGRNAIYMMAPVIQEIEQLNSRLKEDNFLGKGSITISDIRSTAPSLCAVADSATIHLDRRLTRGETMDSALQEIKSLPSVIKSNANVSIPEYKPVSYTGLKYPANAYYPMWALEKSHPLVQTAVKAFEAQFHETPDVDKWVFSTNGVATMGSFNIPTIGFGPGEEKFAHAANELVPIVHLVKALSFYASFIYHWGK